MRTRGFHFHAFHFRRLLVLCFFGFILCSAIPSPTSAQAVPYARTFPKSKVEIQKALNDLQANVGQKLPIVDGFVVGPGQPLDRYQRAFYQFSIELLPGTTSGDTVVRVSAKITAWYEDRDPSQSGYQTLPSSGRLESDLLDRLEEKLGVKVVSSLLKPEAPRPRIDLSSGSPAISLRSSPLLTPSGSPPSAPGAEDVNALATERGEEEKHVQQLNAELQGLQEIQRNQAHPSNLVIVKNSGTPVLARPVEGSRVLFAATADDEFEFLDAEGAWIHVQISGASRGYIRRTALDLPDAISARLDSQAGLHGKEKSVAFRIGREESGVFPGDWEPLKGKIVKIYTVEPASEDPKETSASPKLRFASSLIQKFAVESAGVPPLEGVAVIFDSADGGILGCTLANARKSASGSLSQDAFWKTCYMDPADAFRPAARGSLR